VRGGLRRGGDVSAQLAGPEKMQVGMNSAKASGNARFLLNVMHRLTKQLDR
jgi:hypothetical protein